MKQPERAARGIVEAITAFPITPRPLALTRRNDNYTYHYVKPAGAWAIPFPSGPEGRRG